MSLHPDRPRCAALAARVSAACALLSCARLRAPQDRSRDVLQLWPRLAAKDIYSSRSARACAACGSRMAQRRSRARRQCDVLSWSWLMLFRPLSVLHVQLWSRMVVPARHMFVMYVVQLIQRKISCLESWHGLTLSETTER